MKTRIISAIVALAIVIPLFLLGGIPFSIGAGLIAALAYKEIIELKTSHKPYSMLIILLGFISLELIVFNRLQASYIYNGVSYGIIGLVLLLLLIPSIFDKKGNYTTKDALYLFGITTLIGLFFNLLILLEYANKWLLLYLILIAILTDTFAMIVGCLIGKHKLIPRVSPKKSVEGSIAGSVVATAIASIYYYNVITSNINIFVLIVTTLVLSILGQLGDLLFSKIKRENEIKDFSNIMPGHGGILDRLDSMTLIIFGYIIIINIINMF